MIAGTFAGFQFLMPVIGFFLVRFAEESFSSLQPNIPRIGALILICLGIRMLTEGWHERKTQSAGEKALRSVSAGTLFVQGIATSIDALSVGFLIASYATKEALLAALIIGVVTFIICACGLLLGRVFGMRYSFAATILGGVILICIGIKLLIG